MAQYHLRVAEKELHVRSPGGECSIPLDTSLTSKTLNNVIAHVDTDEGTDVTFQAGVLETWAAQLRCGEPRDLHLPGYGYFSGVYQAGNMRVRMQACDYFVDEKHLNTLCSTLGHRLFSPPGQLPADQHEVLPEQVLASLFEYLNGPPHPCNHRHLSKLLRQAAAVSTP